MHENLQYPWEAAERIAEFLRSPSLYAQTPSPDFTFSAAELHQALKVVFFASLLKEEGRTTNVSVALSRQTIPAAALPFESPVPFTTDNLQKLAPAADPSNTDILVVPREGGLYIVGLMPFIDGQKVLRIFSESPWLRIRAPNPGVLHLEVYGVRLVQFERGRLVLLDPQEHLNLIWTPENMVTKCLEGLTTEPRFFSYLLLSAAQKMIDEGHGGLILVAEGGRHAPGLATGSGYTIHPSGARILADRVHRLSPLCPDEIIPLPEDNKLNYAALTAFEEFSQAVDVLAKLTQIDGAVVLSETMELAQIGAMVNMDASIGSPRVIELYDGTVSRGLVGVGARHKAGAKFCAVQPKNALGIVASQDGALTIVVRNNDFGEERMVILRHVSLKRWR